MDLVWTILIGFVAGTLAGMIIKDRRFGIAGSIAIGVLGAILGGFLLSFLQLFMGILGAVVKATLGAIILLLALRWFQTGRIK